MALVRVETAAGTYWEADVPPLVRRMLLRGANLECLYVSDTVKGYTTIIVLDRPMCSAYTRPPMTLGGPCLNCGASQPEHAKQNSAHIPKGGGVPVATTKKPAKAGKKVTKRTAK